MRSRQVLFFQSAAVVAIMAGIALALGNRLGFFPTFRFSGTIAMFVGFLLLQLAKG